MQPLGPAAVQQSQPQQRVQKLVESTLVDVFRAGKQRLYFTHANYVQYED